ncbi:Guided entry of tail-anchored proteins factor 1 [Caenorhabditis elegans]|uniref:Guided entry of tail-anchored proteins factor 1 n=1 Tax=Caenorhabditis elegans TaxID=6239 RepID=P91485_CAEEL|nr:Guided entry of tail-anchored proteins factor 1 [Caenorhabditis elegans]CCD64268.1 Guided entry of tail-anchored proteins factor 1 [Caenorhabditis elegans]|eukprot:NP_491366.1 Uncharacterized protein CELE_T21E12.5 [Caenorhabditis elegans]
MAQPGDVPLNIKKVDLIDGLGFQWNNSIVRSTVCSIFKVIIKVVFLMICVSACCVLLWLEAITIAKTTPIHTLEEMQQVEDEEALMHIKCFILLLWSFSVYTLITEMTKIMLLNEKIRILESVRHRSKMESTLSLIRQKSYFDAYASDFIIRNQQNEKINTVKDEMDAEEMVHHLVHGMNPHKNSY